MIVSCGEALVDVFTVDGVEKAVVGGGPLNVAIAAARLGVPSAFVGGVSTDAHGQAIWAHLEANDVDLDAAARFDAPTARAIVEHTPKLSFRFEGAGTADTLLDSVDLSALGAGSSADHIVHGGTLGMFRGPTAEALAQLVEGHDGIVSLDPNIRPKIIDDRDDWLHFHDRWVAHTNIYKGSDEDLEWIWPGRSPESCAEELLANGMTVVLITRGSEGLSVLTADGEATSTAPAVQVVDTVGAGDTIVAAILASLWDAGVRDRDQLGAVSLSDWERYGQRAVVAAGITCSRQGADPPRRVELGELWPD